MNKKMARRRLFLPVLALFSLKQHVASSFHIGMPLPSHETLHVMQQALMHSKPHGAAHDLLSTYTNALAHHPLTTKMTTGASLAVCGDAIAQQSKKSDESYDVRRAASFGVFDSFYRALQHVAFPLIVSICHGQFLSRALSDTHFAAAMEQTLASQLIIVPFLYYPAFFALTGFVQGLTTEEAVQRAQDNFLPLMKRNLLFWIPVQFVQFGFVPDELQIPFLSVCGLAWTFILSVTAGSAKQYHEEQEESTAVVQQQMGRTALELNRPPTYGMKMEEEEDLEVEKMPESVPVR